MLLPSVLEVPHRFKTAVRHGNVGAMRNLYPDVLRTCQPEFTETLFYHALEDVCLDGTDAAMPIAMLGNCAQLQRPEVYTRAIRIVTGSQYPPMLLLEFLAASPLTARDAIFVGLAYGMHPALMPTYKPQNDAVLYDAWRALQQRWRLHFARKYKETETYLLACGVDTANLRSVEPLKQFTTQIPETTPEFDAYMETGNLDNVSKTQQQQFALWVMQTDHPQKRARLADLFDKGCARNYSDALTAAIASGDRGIIRYMCKRVPATLYASALNMALERDDLDALRRLVRKMRVEGVGVIVDKEGLRTLLAAALRKGNERFVKYLIHREILLVPDLLRDSCIGSSTLIVRQFFGLQLRPAHWKSALTGIRKHGHPYMLQYLETAGPPIVRELLAATETPLSGQSNDLANAINSPK